MACNFVPLSFSQGREEGLEASMQRGWILSSEPREGCPRPGFLALLKALKSVWTPKRVFEGTYIKGTGAQTVGCVSTAVLEVLSSYRESKMWIFPFLL